MSAAPKAPREEARKRRFTQQSPGWRGAEGAAPLIRIQGSLKIGWFENGEVQICRHIFFKMWRQLIRIQGGPNRERFEPH